MGPVGPIRPRVTRETRRLLAIIFVSLLALLLLARFRFSERPLTPNPVLPVLTQLAPRAAFDDLAFAVSQLSVRLSPVLLAIDRGDNLPGLTALRIRPGLAVALIVEDPGSMQPVARDRASGLVVMSVPAGDAPGLTLWNPRRLDYPRYLFAADVAQGGVSLRPIFIGSLDPVVSPLWPAPVWMTPAHTDLTPGAFVFSGDGALAGLAIERDGRPAIVPGEVLIESAERLARDQNQPRGQLGISVQSLSPSISAATGAAQGVVITSVDGEGPLNGKVAVAEVIEAVDGNAMSTLEHWEGFLARLEAGASVVLRVHGRPDVREVPVTAVSEAPQPNPSPALGLIMRSVVGGVEAVRVVPGSAAARAGLRAGDVITLIDNARPSTPGQVSRTFAAASSDRPVVVAVTRAGSHHVFAVAKR